MFQFVLTPHHLSQGRRSEAIHPGLGKRPNEHMMPEAVNNSGSFEVVTWTSSAATSTCIMGHMRLWFTQPLVGLPPAWPEAPPPLGLDRPENMVPEGQPRPPQESLVARALQVLRIKNEDLSVCAAATPGRNLQPSPNQAEWKGMSQSTRKRT